jgi:tetratricopeptide (TPR) repeat protein
MKKGIWAIIIILIIAAGFYWLNSPESINNKAVRLHAGGKTKEAIALLEKVPASKRNAAIRKNLAVFYQDDGQPEKAHENNKSLGIDDTTDEDKALKKRAEERIKRMIAEGWKDDTATFEVTMNAAFASFQVGKNKDAVILYERALFKKPDDLDLEQKIEDIEELVKKEATATK